MRLPPLSSLQGGFALLLLTTLAPEPDRSTGIDVGEVRPVAIADPASHWARGGFVEMTPPIRLPSQDGRERIVVYLRLPDDGVLEVERSVSGRPTLRFPSGTVADRVDLSDGSRASSVGDVRGTRFAGGHEYFHVLRPLAPPGLSGVEWAREDPAARREATEQMLARLSESHPAMVTASLPAFLARFEAQNDCAKCHEHDKPEQRRREDDDWRPNRATDADGLYTVASVLADGAPLEFHRAREMNDGDPFVQVTCLDASPAVLEAGRTRRLFVCDDGSVPYATLDLRGALGAGDPHARDVCASRAYLGRHMSAEGRAAFRDAFAECDR